MPVQLALLQPDQPGNVGAIMRLCACLAVPLHLVRPAGFPVSDRSLKRSAMDYGDKVQITLHDDWDAFRSAVPGRPVLMTAAGGERLPRFRFGPDDVLMMGSESAGAPAGVHRSADARVRIPVVSNARSLNLAVAAGIALAEALRQVEGWPA